MIAQSATTGGIDASGNCLPHNTATAVYCPNSPLVCLLTSVSKCVTLDGTLTDRIAKDSAGNCQALVVAT